MIETQFFEGRRLLRFEIPGRPQAWQRAGRNKATGITFTKTETRHAMALVKDFAQSRLGETPPTGAPILLELLYGFAVPQSWPAWKREAALDGRVAVTAKPDLDNLEKLVKDALNGVVWADDAQVCRVVKAKVYTDRPRTVVSVTALPLLPAQASRRADLDALDQSLLLSA